MYRQTSKIFFIPLFELKLKAFFPKNSVVHLCEMKPHTEVRFNGDIHGSSNEIMPHPGLDLVASYVPVLTHGNLFIMLIILC